VVAFSGTMGVYGESRKPPSEQAVVALHEDQALQPGDIYGYTKVAGEEMCRYYGLLRKRQKSGMPVSNGKNGGEYTCGRRERSLAAHPIVPVRSPFRVVELFLEVLELLL
jgi:hypothetical protein